MMIGGQVRNHLEFWKTITSDKYILSLIKGVKVPFIHGKLPRQKFVPPELKMSSEEMKFVDVHLSQLIEEGFVRELPSHIPDGWVSNIFLMPKKTGGFRMILNLKQLNKFVKYTKFKMDHVDQVTKLLQPNFVMSSLDLIQAYGHLHIFRAHQKFFQYTWRGRFYCYITLPQVFGMPPSCSSGSHSL